jgi:phenylpropionate dioxygenase-like ring-hydroxylating dioxygenase large terminal subunit
VNQQEMAKLIESHRPGYALAQAFYRSPEIYSRDIDHVYMNAWLYAGHESEIPEIGDYFLFELDTESVIIVRSDENNVNALLNVCRHRGSRVCIEARGKASRLTCAYHGWTYGLHGKLRAAAHLDEGIDKSKLGLKQISVRRLCGMIFVNFSENPSSFDDVEKDLSECLAPYRLDQAKVAHRANYSIDSNWKLAVENYCECYHCAPAHPEYSRGHGLAAPGPDYDSLYDAVMARAEACGLSEKVVVKNFGHSSGAGNDIEFERYPLIRGHLTGSKDGKPVAPLLGNVKDFDGGATDIQVGPVTFGLIYCDHVVIYRFTPRSINKTDCDITWLVNASAEEGKDYNLQELTWLWDITTIADQHIIERNQQGVNSRFYEPGPYSKMEDFTQNFVDRYLQTISTSE